MCRLLDLNIHTMSGRNHDPVLIKRVNNYLNKRLKIFTQEQGTSAVNQDAILLLIYAWNSCAVSLANISRAMVVSGRKFSFPIDFSHNKAVQLTGTKIWAYTYTIHQAHMLLHMQEIVVMILPDRVSTPHGTERAGARIGSGRTTDGR